MKSQAGRYTVAYESKVFPYFTINNYRRDVLSGNHGGIQAFFERLRYIETIQAELELLGIDVTSDCEFLCHDQDIADALRQRLELDYGSKLEEWDTHEAL
jgi:hypothetical protein